MKKQIKYISAGMLAGMLLCGGQLQASNRMTEMHVCLADAIQKDNRPEISNRLFRSNAVEKEILRVQKLLKNAKLAWMFTNCFPNTLDTTVHFRKGINFPFTFVQLRFHVCKVTHPMTVRNSAVIKSIRVRIDIDTFELAENNTCQHFFQFRVRIS